MASLTVPSVKQVPLPAEAESSSATNPSLSSAGCSPATNHTISATLACSFPISSKQESSESALNLVYEEVESSARKHPLIAGSSMEQAVPATADKDPATVPGSSVDKDTVVTVPSSPRLQADIIYAYVTFESLSFSLSFGVCIVCIWVYFGTPSQLFYCSHIMFALPYVYMSLQHFFCNQRLPRVIISFHWEQSAFLEL